MKLFGEYLLEKQIITEDALAKALIDQMKTMPSTAEIVLEKKLFSVKQLLSVFRMQQEKKTGFIEAARDLGFWTPGVVSAVEAHSALFRTPLGQLLVKSGASTLEQITHALDDFFADVEGPAVRPALGPKRIQSDFGTFCDLFIPDLRILLDAPFVEEGLPSEGALKNVKNELHKIRGAARLVMASRTDGFVNLLESLCNTLVKKDLKSASPDLLGKAAGVSRQGVELLWKIQEKMKAVDSEEQVFLQDGLEKTLQDVTAGIEMLRFDLDFLDEITPGRTD